MKKWFLVVGLVAVAATLAAIPGAMGRPAAEPGLTSKTIKIGTTLPLSGPASLYARIGTGMRTYLSYINARKSAVDKKRGVYGRQIILNIYDDQYSEAQTVQQTRRAVEEDKVFAMLGGLGTENQQAVRAYLNQKQIPQLYVSTGLSEFGRLYKQYPWTIGWQPDYVQEGKLLGQYTKNNIPNAKVAVLRQNDDYGKEFLDGYESTVGSGAVVATETYPRGGGAAAISAPVAKLRASGADTFLVIATPTESITALVVAYRIGWRPNKLVNSVGATDTFMTAAKNSAGSVDAVNGVVSTTYLKDPSAAQYANDPQVNQYSAIMAKYAPSFPEPRDDTLFFYGMAKAATFVQALYRAGKNPTRKSLMNAAVNLKIKKFGWLINGSQLTTSPTSAFPIRYQKLRRYNGTTFTEFGALVKTR
jgi:branched-chain amino acid transport system substrate-binding protein